MDEPSFVTYKIVLHGTWRSGKTSFIKAVSEIEVVNPVKDNKDPRVEILGINMDFGRITSNDQTVVMYLFASPMARRFDFLRDLADGALGFILMIDSCKSETFREARATFETLITYSPLPIVIAANFQDLSDAWDVDALRIALRIPNETPILPCVATDRESVKGVVIALLNEVLKDVESQSE
jgi:uncharacterized protein